MKLRIYLSIKIRTCRNVLKLNRLNQLRAEGLNSWSVLVLIVWSFFFRSGQVHPIWGELLLRQDVFLPPPCRIQFMRRQHRPRLLLPWPLTCDGSCSLLTLCSSSWVLSSWEQFYFWAKVSIFTEISLFWWEMRKIFDFICYSGLYFFCCDSNKTTVSCKCVK